MNLKPLASWFAWPNAEVDCDVFQNIPDSIQLFHSPHNSIPSPAMQFENSCPFVVTVDVTNSDEILSNGIGGGGPYFWLDPKSPGPPFSLNCQSSTDGSVPVNYQASTGEQKTIDVTCYESPLKVPFNIRVEVPRSGAEIYPQIMERLSAHVDEVDLWFEPKEQREIYNAYYSMTECCGKCGKGLLTSFCGVSDTLGVPVPSSLKDRFCGGCLVNEQTCQKHSWRSFCDYYESVNIPFLADQQQHLCKSDCGLQDIRSDPGYGMYTFDNDGLKELGPESFQFAFLTADEDYTDRKLKVGRNALISADYYNSNTTVPGIPNEGVDTVFAPMWAGYTDVAEVGGVPTSENIVVQWTDLAMPGGGRVTVQWIYEANGDWKIRTGQCRGDTSYLATAVSGWQAEGGGWENVEICDPCNIALDFTFHRQTLYAPANVSDWLTFPSEVNKWSGNKGPYDPFLPGNYGFFRVITRPLKYGELALGHQGTLFYNFDSRTVAASSVITYR